MRYLNVIALLCCCGLVAAELPVREVILYKHGVGFFERTERWARANRRGSIFGPREMNDVLKSLTIQEKGGGKSPACATTPMSRWPRSSTIFLSSWPMVSR